MSRADKCCAANSELVRSDMMKISCHCNSGKPLFPSKTEVGNIQQSVYKSSLAALKFTSKFWTWSLYYEGNKL